MVQHFVECFPDYQEDSMPTTDDLSTPEPTEGNGRGEVTRQTTLYDLIRTVQEAIEPGEDPLILPTVVHILRTRRAHWLGSSTDC